MHSFIPCIIFLFMHAFSFPHCVHASQWLFLTACNLSLSPSISALYMVSRFLIPPCSHVCSLSPTSWNITIIVAYNRSWRWQDKSVDYSSLSLLLFVPHMQHIHSLLVRLSLWRLKHIQSLPQFALNIISHLVSICLSKPSNQASHKQTHAHTWLHGNMKSPHFIYFLFIHSLPLFDVICFIKVPNHTCTHTQHEIFDSFGYTDR